MRFTIYLQWKLISSGLQSMVRLELFLKIIAELRFFFLSSCDAPIVREEEHEIFLK